MIKIYDIETLEEREILFRGGSGADVSAPVAEILRAVQERGDAALREYTLRFDGAAPDALARDYRKVSLFARKEGLDAPARAVDIRFEGGEA